MLTMAAMVMLRIQIMATMMLTRIIDAIVYSVNLWQVKGITAVATA